MSKFHSGKNPEQIRSSQWLSSSYGFKGHLCRLSLGTSDAAEYPHAAADLLWGVLSDDGTQFNWIPVETRGVVKCMNSLAGTINIGDPIILDYTNSNGTTGFVKSAYTTETLTAVAPLAVNGNEGNGTYFMPASHGLVNKAVPGSIRVVAKVGLGVPAVLEQNGTTIVADGTHGFGTSTIAYTIDQPSIGYALDKATSPRQLFRVQVAKDRYIKNNTVN